MTAPVHPDHDLPTLRVHLRGPAGDTPAAAAPVAEFQVLRGQDEAVWEAVVATRQLGLADWIRSARDVREADFTVPDHLVTGMSAALARLAEPDDRAFWLDLPSPRGHLHFLPWERLISPSLDRPLLRLPNFTLRPIAPGARVRVVLAAAQTKTLRYDVVGTLAELARLWLESTGRSVLIEVFPPPSDVDDVRDRIGRCPGVSVHDSRHVGPYISGVSRNGWVTWVRTALAGRGVDLVHLVSHGTMAGERGALALPRLSLREESAWPGMLTAVDLCTSLNRAGAWGLVITAPPGSYCPAALRDVADAVAQARPGVVALHESDSVDAAGQLRAALRMLLDGEPPRRSLPGVLCSSHPPFVSVPDKGMPFRGTDGTSKLIADTTHEVLVADDTPAWVAAGARTIEALQARLAPAQGQRPHPDAVAALEVVSKLFEQQVRAFAQRKASGGEATS